MYKGKGPKGRHKTDPIPALKINVLTCFLLTLVMGLTLFSKKENSMELCRVIKKDMDMEV